MNGLPLSRPGFHLVVSAFMLLLFLPTPSVGAADESLAKDLIENTCSNCHKFQGKPESKFNLQAPDLMWGGVKYQRGWLVGWLMGKEENLYPNGYRWDEDRTPAKHMTLSKKQAEAVADYMEKHHRDPRVKENAIDLSDFNEMERQFGEQIYRQYSCFGCHQIKDEDGKKIGGPISVTLYDAGKRYDVDWLYRFALNPQDFTPHSGEYLADLSGLGVRYVVGYLMTLGNPDFKFYEPWTSKHFKNASVDNGKKLYGIYCAQCHGPKGKGDGVGAAGLDPKPAVHAELPLSAYPEDYLYNVIYYGGKSVGKSPNMPDWGLTLSPQGLADVIAYLRATFKGN